MPTFNREQILARAMRRASIDFLKSEAVARAVVERLRNHFGKRMPPGTISMTESARHPGTWRVAVIHFRRAEISYVNQTLNHNEAKRIADAIRAVFRADDLVTSWTHPRRSHR